jgi:5'-nucleotidase
VDAKKPRFFSSGTALREVELETGSLKLGSISKFESGHVYQGGSKMIFSLLSGAKVCHSYSIPFYRV